MSEAIATPPPESPDLDAESPGQDSVKQYFSEISRTALLTAEDEVDHAKRIEAGVFASRLIALASELRDPSVEMSIADKSLAEKYRPISSSLQQIAQDGVRSKEKMVEANLRLVVSIAKRYIGRGLPFQDLIQEGSLGLNHAVEKFDYAKGFKFSTYATWWIRQSITRGIAEQGRLIRIPTNKTEVVNKCKLLEREYFQEFGDLPSNEYLAELMSLTIDKVKELKAIGRAPVSLDQPLSHDAEATIADVVADKAIVEPEAQVELETTNRSIHEAIDKLEPRQAKVIRMRYGINGSAPLTLDEASVIMGISKERVRQLQKRAEVRLKELFKTDGITL